MSKLMMLAVAAAVVAVPIAFAQESAVPLGEGEAIMISPDGSMHKSNTKVLAAHHQACDGAGRRGGPTKYGVLQA
jgi:hypothetical protein